MEIPSEFEDVVCLVDGLDEKYRYKQIAEHIKNGRGCYIRTVRENKFDIKFNYEIKLRPLTDIIQMIAMLQKHGGSLWHT